MLEIAIRMIAFLAGFALCAAVARTAVRRHQRNGDTGTFFVSLVAAAVALISGLFTQLLVLIHIELPSGDYAGATEGHALFAYFTSLAALPVGMACGWALSFVCGPADATAQETKQETKQATRQETTQETEQARVSGFIVRGLALGLSAASAMVIVDLAARLAWHGHDNTIGPPGLTAVFLFLGLMMLLGVGLTANFRTMSVGGALRQAGAGFCSAFMLSLGSYIGAAALHSMGAGFARIVETWNILVFFYPFYLGGSLAITAALLFYGGKLFAKAWSRPSVA